MPGIFDILNSNGIDLISNIKSNLASTGTNATLKTSQSLRIEVIKDGDKTRLKLFGRPFFMSVETGRRPTKQGAPKSEPTLVDAIKEWMEAKGIAGSPWAIAKKIHSQGTNLFRQGGRADIVQPAKETFIYNVESQWLDEKMDQIIIKAREIGNGS